MVIFKSHAEAFTYYKRCVDNQKEKIAHEVALFRERLAQERKILADYEALMEHNRKQMEQKETEHYD